MSVELRQWVLSESAQNRTLHESLAHREVSPHTRNRYIRLGRPAPPDDAGRAACRGVGARGVRLRSFATARASPPCPHQRFAFAAGPRARRPGPTPCVSGSQSAGDLGRRCSSDLPRRTVPCAPHSDSREPAVRDRQRQRRRPGRRARYDPRGRETHHRATGTGTSRPGCCSIIRSWRSNWSGDFTRWRSRRAVIGE